MDQVSFQLQKGTLNGLIGPNGAGKTTLFNLISGAMPVSSGHVQFLGQTIKNPQNASKLGIARTFQNIRLFQHLSVLENVMVGMGGIDFLSASFRLPSMLEAERLRKKKAYYLLENVGIETLAEKLAHEIPFGQQRLVEIARALATSPKMLLLDEPAAGLNRTETAALASLVRRLHEQEITILVVEHDMHFIMNLVDRIIVLDRGQKIADGTPSQIQSCESVCQAYLGTDTL